MTKTAEILLIGSIIIILSYFTTILSYNIGLAMKGPIPTAHAEDIRQYGIFLDDPTAVDYKDFAEWQTKRIFKQTLSELEIPLVEETNNPIIYTIEDWDEFVRSRRLNTNIWHSSKKS